jgi:YegS/Rv2252/BmrU family lipid kinase
MPEKKINNKWLVIVNPHAGSMKCQRDWPKIKAHLEEEKFNMDIFFTERKYHGMQMTQNLVDEKGYKKIIAVGGDGTLNEVVNGIFKQKRFKTEEVVIGMITVGTGNDWARMYDMPESYKKQVKLLTKGYTFLQDVGKVNYLHSEDSENRYFVNIAGMGYDALVAQKTNLMKEKGKGGPVAYLVNLISGLFQYKSISLNIKADGQNVFSGKVFSMSIGICKYNGGGMMQLPNAIADDGLFDITVIRKTTKLRIVTNIKNLYDGSFVNMPEVSLFTGKKITITARPANKLYLETDGESLGHSPLEFEIVPRAITLFVKKNYSVVD